MRKLYVPITVDSTQNRDQYLKDFKELGVDHVFLSAGERWPLVGEGVWTKWMDLIEEANAFYTGKGYECGVWISTIGYGGALCGGVSSVLKLCGIGKSDRRDGEESEH